MLPARLYFSKPNLQNYTDSIVLDPELKKKVLHYQSSTFCVILDQDGTVKRSVLNIIVEF